MNATADSFQVYTVHPQIRLHSLSSCSILFISRALFAVKTTSFYEAYLIELSTIPLFQFTSVGTILRQALKRLGDDLGLKKNSISCAQHAAATLQYIHNEDSNDLSGECFLLKFKISAQFLMQMLLTCNKALLLWAVECFTGSQNPLPHQFCCVQ